MSCRWSLSIESLKSFHLDMIFFVSVSLWSVGVDGGVFSLCAFRRPETCEAQYGYLSLIKLI